MVNGFRRPVNSLFKPAESVLSLTNVRGNQEFIQTIWCLCYKTSKLKKRKKKRALSLLKYAEKGQHSGAVRMLASGIAGGSRRAPAPSQP
jgi:hypothetical protein